MSTKNPDDLLPSSAWDIPSEVLEFVKDQLILSKLPAFFVLENIPWRLEIQYFLDVKNPRNYRPESQLLAFAINTDGGELLVDVGSQDLDILQDEAGDVDSLGITLADVAVAACESIPDAYKRG